MSLAALMEELTGMPVQSHPITYAGKTKSILFKQFDLETGREIYRKVEGEPDDARNTRIFRSLIAASVCDDDGSLAATSPDEVGALPQGLQNELWDAVVKTNNILVPKSEDEGDGEGVNGPKH